jgi:CheY-like chemotaxis protein
MSQSKGKILVVEDNIIQKMMYAKCLEDLGYDVLPADNAYRAIQTLQDNAAIRLVILDHFLKPEQTLNLVTGKQETACTTGERVANYLRNVVWRQHGLRAPAFISASDAPEIVQIYPTLGKGTAYEGMTLGIEKEAFLLRLSADKPDGWFDHMVVSTPVYDPKAHLCAREECRRQIAGLAYHL